MTSNEPPFSTIPPAWPERLLDWGLLAIVVLAPTQVSFAALGIKICPVDFAVGITCLLWLFVFLRSRDRGEFLRLPPLALWLFPLLTALSVIKATNAIESAREVLQLMEYFVVWALLLLGRMPSPVFVRRLLLAFFGVASVVLVLGIIQYFMPGVPTFQVRATFSNRNILGGFLALIMPLALGQLLWEPRPAVKAWMAVLLAGGSLLTLAGGTWIALCVALTAVAALCNGRAILITLMGMSLITAAVLPRLPRAHLQVLKESINLFNDQGEMNPRYTEWQAALNMAAENPLLGVGIGNYQLNIGRYYGYVPRENRNVTEPDSHNLYLVLLSSTGLLGLMSFLGLLAFYFARSLSACRLDLNDPWMQGLAAGSMGAILAFAINSIWAGLLVRGLGIPLVLVLLMGSASPRNRGK